MRIKTRQEILQEMIQYSRNNNSNLTDFNVGGVARSIMEGIAAVLAQLYYELYRIFRSGRISYANSTDLDAAVARRSIKRRSSSKATVDLRFTASGTIEIPAGFRVSTDGGIEFVTTEVGSVSGSGTYNVTIVAEAVVAGKSGNVAADLISTLVDSVDGVIAVVNLMRSRGGYEYEADEMLRSRAINQLATLSLGIPASYNAWANCGACWGRGAKGEWGNTSYSDKTVIVHCQKYNAGSFTEAELDQIAAYIQKKCPLGVVIVCLNIVYTTINITVEVVRLTGFTLNDVRNNIADNLNLYMDYREWEWGIDVDRADLFALCNNTLGVGDLADSFVPTDDTVITEYAIPVIGTVTVTDYS